MAHNDPEPQLPESDVRLMVRLLAKVARTTGGIVAQKRCLIEGMAELTDTDVWMWNVLRVEAGSPPVPVSLMHNLHEREFAVLADITAKGEGRAIDAGAHALNQQHRHWTRTGAEVVGPGVDYKALPYIRICRDKIGLGGESLFSVHQVPDRADMCSAIVFHRRVDRPAYTWREARILHILGGEVDWLHQQGTPADDGKAAVALSPRLQSVLTLLIDGQSAKRIAHHLGLSYHTVRSYIKQVYAHYGVSGRAELLHRFMVGDGGDRGR